MKGKEELIPSLSDTLPAPHPSLCGTPDSWSPWRDQSTSPLGYSHLNLRTRISLPYSHGSLLAEIYCHPGLAFQLLIDCLWDACNKLQVYLACEILLLSSLVPGC